MGRTAFGAMLMGAIALGGCGAHGPNSEDVSSVHQALVGYGSTIKYPAVASADVIAIAGALKTVLDQMTGSSFTVAAMAANDPGNAGIYLANPGNWGSLVPPPVLAHQAQLTAGTRGSYAMSSDGSSYLWITAVSAHGLSNGIYSYLDQLGCRWLLPGANWDVIPSRALSATQVTLDGFFEPAISTFAFTGQGGFLWNIWQHEHARGHDLPTLHEDRDRWGSWAARNRFPTNDVIGGHSYSKFFTARESAVRADPLSLAEIDGVRTFLPTPLPTETALKLHYTGHGTHTNDNGGGAYTLAYSDGTNNYYEDPNDYTSQSGVVGQFGSWAVSQLNVYANQDLPNATTTSVEPSDGGGHCDCQKCKALLRKGPYANMPAEDSSISDRVFHVSNMAAKAVKAAFPNTSKGVTLLAYREHAVVPHIPLEPNTTVWVTPNAYHFPYTGLSPDALLDAWGNKSATNPAGPFQLAIYDYISTPSDTYGAIRQNTVALQDKMQRWYSGGYHAVALESSFGAGPAGPTALLGGKTAWNTQTTAAAVLDGLAHDAFSAGAYPYLRPIFAALYEQPFSVNYQGLGKLLGLLKAARSYLDASGTSIERARLSDLESYGHYLRLLYTYQTQAANSQAGCDALDALFRWMWCIDKNMMLPTRRLHELFYAKNQCSAATMTPNRSRWDWTAIPNAAGFVDVASCDPFPTMAQTISDDLVAFPALDYRVVTYARSLDEYYVLPTPTPPTAPPPVDIHLKRPNHFIFNVASTRSVQLKFSAANSTSPIDLTVYDATGAVIKTYAVPSTTTGVVTSVDLGVLLAGNYEFDLIPRSNTLTYSVLIDPTLPIAFKDGAHLAVNSNAYYLYFYVPYEVDTAFIQGTFNGALTPVFYPPTGGSIVPTPIDSQLFKLDTHGKPGVWAVRFTTLNAPASFINLPNVFSFDPKAVITSKRIRTDMVSATGGATAPVTSPNLRYNNRFAFHLATAASPTFTIGIGSGVASPPPLEVDLLDKDGAHLPGSPFSLASNASYPISAGLLPAGDYELHVKNPTLDSAYAVTVPAGVPFVSVDGYGLGNVWLPSYLAYFNVPAGVSSVRFAAKPAGTPITVYGPSGVVANQPVALGNNVYEIQNTTPGLWALNLRGEYWSDIRLLNVPQIISFDARLLMSVAP